MAYGTETVPAVHKIFGPGNQYVTRAKSIIQSTTRVAIDMPAGPSEVLVIADPNAKPAFVAADLIAQAEHGADSQAILVSWDKNLIEQTGVELEKQLATLPRAELARAALAQSYAVWVPGREEAIAFSNLYAPEHLILSVEDTPWFVPKILNAGSVFLGYLSAESMGDYASGTNHTL